MDWYLIYTKPRQENLALQNLQQQDYTCFLPMLLREKVKRNTITTHEEALFPRYLFVQLSSDLNGPSWSPIRSTIGVCSLVRFGQKPAKVAPALIEALQNTSNTLQTPAPLFQPGDKLQITSGPFSGIEALYQTTDKDKRVLVLFEMLQRPVSAAIEASNLRKIS